MRGFWLRQNDDKYRGDDKYNDNSRFPSGMTNKRGTTMGLGGDYGGG